MIRKQSVKLYKEIFAAMTERVFLKDIGMNAADMEQLLLEKNWTQLTVELLEETNENGRFRDRKSVV